MYCCLLPISTLQRQQRAAHFFRQNFRLNFWFFGQRRSIHIWCGSCTGLTFTAILHFLLALHSFTLHKALKILARSNILLKLSFRETLTHGTASTVSKAITSGFQCLNSGACSKSSKKKSLNYRSVTWLAGKRTSSFSAHNRSTYGQSCNSEVMTTCGQAAGSVKISQGGVHGVSVASSSNSVAVREVVP